ncbi:MAG: peptidoglycan bridge formation glycyltransferase FemA/FemB family protein [Patescibacteria group bacterium]|nr:peptidoglycan bridge formation glycyltransferase FemA/FemB family protein [Patescibacteria group bacterium]
MEVREINNKEVWEDFLLNCKEKTFLQSWNWGEFNKMMDNRIYRLGVFHNDNLASIAQIIKISAKRGNFLFLPHGPVLKPQTVNYKQQVLETLLEEMKELAKEENCSFIRIGPIWERNEENIDIFKKLNFRESPIHIHPELTWELDISSSEEELLAQMRKTTRYLIRKGMRNREIKIMKSKDIIDIEIFNKLYQKTKKRKQFVPFPLKYLENEFRSFSIDNQILIFLGKYLNMVVASGVFIFWQDIGFYHHGASSLEYPKIPASYSVLWEAIKEAKDRGCQRFNFWGIAPTTSLGANSGESQAHPWAGLSLFKMGFGGKAKEYVKTQDLVLSKKYWSNFLVEKLRRIKRSL